MGETDGLFPGLPLFKENREDLPECPDLVLSRRERVKEG
jgi:hypothetical protein